MSWEVVSGGTLLLLVVIGGLVAVSKRWGFSVARGETSKKEAEDAKKQRDRVFNTPIPDHLVRAAAARRRLRELRKK